jgi:hypothetical protein
MSEDLVIRVGTPQDVDVVMEIAMMACEENGFVQPSPQRLLTDIWPALNLDEGVMGLIGPRGTSEVQGVVLLRIGHMWYSEQRAIEEKAVFIRPEYRSAKGGRARKLCEFSKQVADELELPLIIGVLSNQRTSGKVRMYQRIFGEPSGAFFLYKAKTGSWQAAAE